jgi:nucleotide-binding universal stress UspA family protein
MEAAGNYGLWLSGTCGATLTAAAPMIEPSLPPYVRPEMPGDLIARIREDAETEASKILNEFLETARQTSVTVETLRFKALYGEVGSVFCRVARCFDAAVLPQSDSNGVDTSDTIEATLFGSGRPLFIIPYIPASPALGTVLIAWDGGEPAARAVADALPILTLARHVRIVTFSNGANESLYLSGKTLERHLARHGIDAEARRIPQGEIDVANMLLSHAADVGADLIVMGGYGHSRLRETVLGGTTREILRSMTIPVMMSH